jgi:hypothetical protein
MSIQRCHCKMGCNGEGWDWSGGALPGSTPRDETTVYCACPAGAELQAKERASDIHSLLYGGPLSRAALYDLPGLYLAGAAAIEERLRDGPPFEEGEAFALAQRERFLGLAVRTEER